MILPCLALAPAPLPVANRGQELAQHARPSSARAKLEQDWIPLNSTDRILLLVHTCTVNYEKLFLVIFGGSCSSIAFYYLVS